jgi:hypothetical protein
LTYELYKRKRGVLTTWILHAVLLIEISKLGGKEKI